MSADQTQGLQFGTRAISLHATSYVDSKDFLGRWAAVLDVIDAANLGAFVERAGLRYIDLIVPSSERTPAEYLDRGLRGVVPSGAVSVGSMWAAEFQIDGVSVNLRAAAPAPPGLLFPPDFNALPLTKPSILVEAEKRLKEQKPIGFIDTDCLKDVRRLFGASDLVGVYSDMQKKVSQTFTTALSPEALEEWK
jgi:uncharacterized protein (TIGR04255 family)